MLEKDQSTKPTACAMLRYEVAQADLPVSCPLPRYRLWDAHPCVYLPMTDTGRAICPYCNAEYVYKDP